MNRLALAVALSIAAPLLPSLSHREPSVPGPEKRTVQQLTETLAASRGKSDADVTQQLSAMELSERMDAAALSRLLTDLPGDRSRNLMMMRADQSAFLPTPETEVLGDPAPNSAATRQMLVQVVNYVNTTLRQLPNLMATRTTTSFQDQPQEDVLESTATVSYSYQPLHYIGAASAIVTYRDRKEVVDERGAGTSKHGGKIGGLITTGEFGSALISVVADALKGKITWARWEHGDDANLAVFHYTVPAAKSNYHVKFCCITGGPDQRDSGQIFDRQAEYHGEIAFTPNDGAIVRVSLQADLPADELVANAGILVEYAPVSIGGKSVICPQRSVSLLTAHTTQPPKGMHSLALYKGPTKTYLNDVEFGSYRRFGSETRMLTGVNETPQ
jgi:hypothetical protein